MNLGPEVGRPSWGDFVMLKRMLELAGCLRDVGTHAVRGVVMIWRLVLQVMVSQTVSAIEQ